MSSLIKLPTCIFELDFEQLLTVDRKIDSKVIGSVCTFGSKAALR